MGSSGNRVQKIKEGKRYGKLTALTYIGNEGGYRKWRCRCDCGKIIDVQESHLKTGHTKSCGCLRMKYVSRYGKDLAGMHFGNLTVVSKDASREGRTYWICRCDCGNTVSVMESHLKDGHTKSCGCFKINKLKDRAYDLTGKVFGRLTVLRPAEEGYWRCRCECGNECTVYKENLTRGNTKSCGCLLEETRKENMKKAIHFVDGTCVERIASRKLFANNTTGHTGVCRIENGKYRSFIGFKNKKYSIGTYSSIEEAVEARKKKEEELFRSFLEKYYSGEKTYINS